MLKIVCLPVNNDGCGWYRVRQPYTVLKDLGLADVIITAPGDLETAGFLERAKEADYFVLRLAHYNFVKWLDQYLPGKKIILDIDDYLHEPDPYGPLYRTYGTSEIMAGSVKLWEDGKAGFDIERNKKQIAQDLEFIKRADLLTVSTPRLKEKFAHKNCYVLYNGLDLNIWKPHQIEKKEVRLGWSGGVTHYSDLAIIADDLAHVVNNYNVRLIVSGSIFNGIYKGIDKSKIDFQPWIDISGHPYRTIVNNIDIAFIPLANNSFNDYKSCVKFYEYASVGAAVIATNRPPYSDEMPAGALYNKDFREKIVELIDDKDKRQKNADEGRQWVVNNREIKSIITEFAKAL